MTFPDHDFAPCLREGEHALTQRHNRVECPAESLSVPIYRSHTADHDLQAMVKALEASLLFLDAAVHGNVTEPEDAPHSETEMVFDCYFCQGRGEVAVGQWEDGQWETARCPECEGTGEVSY